MHVSKFFGEAVLNLEEVSRKSKKGQELIARWRASCKETLWEAYATPSKAKVKAYEAIREEMRLAEGDCFRVTGASTYQFSCAYVAQDSDRWKWLICHSQTRCYGVKLYYPERSVSL